jgi:hypothetical protein
MSLTLLSIAGATLPGEDRTALPVDSFSWGSSDGSLTTLDIVRALNQTSPQVVTLFRSGGTSRAVLDAFDDAGERRLELDLTDAKVTRYAVSGGAADPLELFTLDAARVQMTVGDAVAVVP